MTPQPNQVWLALEPVDMRLGIDGLSLRVQQALGRAPCGASAACTGGASSGHVQTARPAPWIRRNGNG